MEDLELTGSKTVPVITSLVLTLILFSVELTACSQDDRNLAPTPTIRPVKTILVNVTGISDPSGRLLEDLPLVSEDGMVKVNIPAGSQVLDNDGQPVREIVIIDRPERGLAYEFQPVGTSISPPTQLQICFDPSQLPPFARENPPMLGFFKNDVQTWAWLELVVDLETHCVSSMIEQLGTFILIFDIPQGVPKS